MKLIYVVVDGMGDLPTKGYGWRTPLEAAETPNMDFLAAQGVTGLMFTVRRGFAPESDVAVMSILGFDPFKYSTGRGALEAVGSGLKVRDGDLTLRCNFATAGSRDVILDRRVGRTLKTSEAVELSNAVNKGVKLESHPASFQFKSSVNHRAALAIRSESASTSSRITNTDPAYVRVGMLGAVAANVKMFLKKCKPTENIEAAKVSADLVNEFTEKSRFILENHLINRRRLKEGKLAANLVLTRDAADRLPKLFNVNVRYRRKFACLAGMPVEKGIAKLAGMHVVSLPPPSADLTKDCDFRVKKISSIFPLHDCFYIHIKGPDEPGHDGDFGRKAELISTIDKNFLGPLLKELEHEKTIFCVTADHSTPCKLRAHSDDPVPLLVSGGGTGKDNVNVFSEKECKNGGLGILDRGTLLIPMLMKLLKKGEA